MVQKFYNSERFLGLDKKYEKVNISGHLKNGECYKEFEKSYKKFRSATINTDGIKPGFSSIGIDPILISFNEIDPLNKRKISIPLYLT